MNFQQELKLEIGGVFGLGAKVCKTTIYLEKNEFYAGEKIPVRIVCDNTKCEKAVKSFKFKLFRRYQCIHFPSRQVSHGAGYLFNNKEPGINGGEQIDKVFEVQLPENNFSSYKQDEKIVDRAGTSYVGNFYYIDFDLNVFVKHDAWNEFGEGASVSFPLRIH